ncbi:MAG: sulfurtransferase [Flavobacteriaceae bacterium]|nr:sulfurtransferase [Flavobacteriaceae bacterium]
MEKPLVSADWLHQNIDNSKLVVLDATMRKVTSKSEEISESKQIKNARFINIKNSFSDASALFPNTMLSAEKFQEQAQELGINNDSLIVVYDNLGVYSSPRVWWMFKAMGHQNIAVLDGGFPEWKKAKYPTEGKKEFVSEKGNFIANYNPNCFCDYKTVLNSIFDKKIIVLDARSQERFSGTIEEPRKGLRSGHIPSSINLPYAELQFNGKMKSSEELKKIMSSRIKKNGNAIFSCGSGITACILALGAEISGYENNSVYDGSWTEWGSLTELPIEK